jgi:putative hydrolase of the HAD superfamily
VASNGPLPASIEAVLFDLDDTLIDSHTAWRAGFVEVIGAAFERYPALAALASAEELSDGVFSPFVAEEHAAAGGGEWDRAFVRRAFRRLLAEHGERDDAFADDLFDVYYAAWPRHMHLFPDARATLDALGQRYRLALVSNGRSHEQRRKIAQFELEQHFEVLAISEELGALKPDRAIFRHALDALGVQPSAALHVGDDARADIDGAKAAGLSAVWVNRRGAVAEGDHAPDAEVSTLAEVTVLLGIEESG